MYQFYDADFRVRIHVANALLRRMASLEGEQDTIPILQNLFLQCAVCYEIGFGVARDPCKSQELISRCDEHDHINFAREMELMRGEQYHWDTSLSTNYGKMSRARTVNMAPKHSHALSYVRQGNVEHIELQYWNEITDAENCLGTSHSHVFDLKRELRDILIRSGKNSEAENLKVQIEERNLWVSQYDPSRTSYYTDNPNTLRSLSKQVGRAREAEEICLRNLSAAMGISTAIGSWGTSATEARDMLELLSDITSNQERWEEAEMYSAEALESSVKVLGQTHPDSMARFRDLAHIYGKQGKWEEAEALFTRSIETSIKILGEEHRIYIDSLASLVWMRILQQLQRPRHRREWRKIESQQVKVMKKFIQLYGRDHKDTITSMNNLAQIWSKQRLWRIAATLLGQALRASEEVYGKEHPYTLKYMTNRAVVLEEKMFFNMSLVPILRRRQTCDGTLFEKLLELSTKIHRWDNPQTLNRAEWLVRALQGQ